MNHKPNPRFWNHYNHLPKEIQDTARKQFKRLQENQNHPSLHFKRLKSDPRLWSARVTLDYRAVAVQCDDTYLWSWIGSHAEFDRMFPKG